MENKLSFAFIAVSADLTVVKVFDDEGEHLHTYSKNEGFSNADGWYDVDTCEELRGGFYQELARAYRGWKHNTQFKKELEAFKRLNA